MSYYIGLPLFLAVALLQVAAMPSFSLLGITPDILLIFAACWAMIRGPRQALVLVPVAALFQDLLTTNPVGASIIALAPLIVLAEAHGRQPTDAHFMPALLIVAVGTLAYHLLDSAVMAALGQEVPWTAALARRWLPAMAVNAVLTPAFYLPLWWASRDQRAAVSIRWRN